MVLAIRDNGNGYCFRAMLGSSMMERGMGALKNQPINMLQMG
jgi:hypothetical protein